MQAYTGGVVAINGSILDFDRISFYGNSGSLDNGSALHLYSDSYAVVTNSIFWNDSLMVEAVGSVDISFSNILGGWEGEGNIDVDPLFCNPDSILQTWAIRFMLRYSIAVLLSNITLIARISYFATHNST